MDVTEDPVPVPAEGILFESVITLSYTGKLLKLKKLLIFCEIKQMLINIENQLHINYFCNIILTTCTIVLNIYPVYDLNNHGIQFVLTHPNTIHR